MIGFWLNIAAMVAARFNGQLDAQLMMCFLYLTKRPERRRAKGEGRRANGEERKLWEEDCWFRLRVTCSLVYTNSCPELLPQAWLAR